METRKCSRHNNGEGADLPVSAFYKLKSGYYYSYCKECGRKALYEWRKKHPEQHKSICEKWKKGNPDALRESETKAKVKWRSTHRERDKAGQYRDHVKRAHGLTPEWYENKYREQSGLCAICRKPPEPNRRLCIDHNHATEQYRGLLCLRCNTALERMETIPDWHSKALEYLGKYVESGGYTIDCKDLKLDEVDKRYVVGFTNGKVVIREPNL